MPTAATLYQPGSAPRSVYANLGPSVQEVSHDAVAPHLGVADSFRVCLLTGGPAHAVFCVENAADFGHQRNPAAERATGTAPLFGPVLLIRAA